MSRRGSRISSIRARAASAFGEVDADVFVAFGEHAERVVAAGCEDDSADLGVACFAALTVLIREYGDCAAIDYAVHVWIMYEAESLKGCFENLVAQDQDYWCN